ncbi:MAG: hypothetical protein HUJ62_02880 [Streptococcus gallolyticus]|nr:hypothetical protein [Streptococcus gallolyticus]
MRSPSAPSSSASCDPILNVYDNCNCAATVNFGVPESSNTDYPIFRNNTNTSTTGDFGGAIYFRSESETFNMYCGEISGNKAYKGGAVYIGDSRAGDTTAANINFYGGKITNNKLTNASAFGVETSFKNISVLNYNFSGNTFIYNNTDESGTAQLNLSLENISANNVEVANLHPSAKIGVSSNPTS